jgi:hypothetical protein
MLNEPGVVQRLSLGLLDLPKTLAPRHSAGGVAVGDVPADASQLRESQLRNSPLTPSCHGWTLHYNAGDQAVPVTSITAAGSRIVVQKA